MISLGTKVDEAGGTVDLKSQDKFRPHNKTSVRNKD